MLSWTKRAAEIAKTERLHLVKITLNGKHAKRGTMEFSGPVGPKTAEQLWMILKQLANAKERMK